MAEPLPPGDYTLTQTEIDEADTVLVIFEDGRWRFTTKTHSNTDVGDALIRIGVTIKAQEGTL